MPRTPRAPRPMARTSDSLKRAALPELAVSRMSRLPSVMAAPTKVLSSVRPRAIRPLGRGRENWESSVFLTVPSAVAMNTKRSPSKLFTGKNEVRRSSWPRGSRLMSGRPLALRLPWGMRNTRSQ